MTPKMSKADAQKFGEWLGLYEIDVVGLTCWQVGESGRLYKDEPLADTVTAAVGFVGGGVGGGAVGGMVAAPLAPILAPLLAPFAPLILPALLASIPASLAGIFHLRKHDGEPMAAINANDRIVATLLKWRFGNVSERRCLWSEYLIAVHAAMHSWTDVRGFRYPEQMGVGAAYAARTGTYPPPRSLQPRTGGSGATRRTRKLKRAPTVSRARRAWRRIIEDL